MDERSRHFLKDYLRAKRDADDSAMRIAWEKLVEEEWEQTRSSVRYASYRVLVSDHERDEALRIVGKELTTKLVETFDGSTLETFRGCVAGVARFACMRVRHDAIEHNKKFRSLDATTLEGDDPAAYVNEVYLERAEEDAADEAADELLEMWFAEGRDFLDWAVPQLPPRPRAVIEKLREGLGPEEIADELGVTRNVVDVNKMRAIKRLTELKEQ